MFILEVHSKEFQVTTFMSESIKGLRRFRFWMNMAKFIKEYRYSLFYTSYLNKLFLAMSMLPLLSVENDTFTWMWLEWQFHIFLWLEWWLQFLEDQLLFISSFIQDKISSIPCPDPVRRMSRWNSSLWIDNKPLVSSVMRMVYWNFVIFLIFGHSYIKLMVRFVS